MKPVQNGGVCRFARYSKRMAFGVFVYRSDSVYHDSPAERYQFPRQYLGCVREIVGDWIVYYEPRTVKQTRGYFATAKIRQVIPDLSAPGMYLAIIEPGSYLDFACHVPFSGVDGLTERGLQIGDGKISGRAQWAVRLLSPSDFKRIVDLGTAEESLLLPREVPEATPSMLNEERAPFVFEQQRERVEATTSRVVRDRVFRRVVLDAYDERCAITGLKLINGGGRAEVEAAHIRPVNAQGPDIISNGLALSGTAHWMFDRGLISLADDLAILISRQVNDREGVEAIINRTGYALAPERPWERPHPHFLSWHRENCFKQ